MLELVNTSPWAWTALCLLLGLIAGGLQAGGWRVRLSNDLLGEQERQRLLETKSEHQRFGISDLKLRIRLSQREGKLLNTDLKLLRSTYARLDEELRAQWDAEIHLKAELVNQQADVERLQSELADWKSRLSALHDQLDEGSIDEAQLKKELTLGITAVCEHNSSEMTAVQTLLQDCASQIDEQTMTREPQKVIGLLAAKVELLEGQTYYWQDLAIANQQAKQDQPDGAAIDFKTTQQVKLGTVQLNEDTAKENSAANTDEQILSDAPTDPGAEYSQRTKQSKRSKRRSRAKLARGKKNEAADPVAADSSAADPKAVSQQA